MPWTSSNTQTAKGDSMHEATAADLRAERARLERATAELRVTVGRESAKLADARARGPRPRGLGPGIALGVALVLVAIAWVFYAWVNFMRHMG
jgi:hypothetical protein